MEGTGRKKWDPGDLSEVFSSLGMVRKPLEIEVPFKD